MEKYNWDTGLTTAQVDALQAKQSKKPREALLVIDPKTGLYDWTNFYCYWTGMRLGATGILRRKWTKAFLKKDGVQARNSGTYVTARFIKAFCIVEGIPCKMPYVPLEIPDYDYEMFRRIMLCHGNPTGNLLDFYLESIPAEKRNIVAYFTDLAWDSKIGYKIGMNWDLEKGGVGE
jgi:hypothetical protein